MSKIQVLQAVIANRIAAGEVVERPASVIKELVENSIDANATSIEITVVQAGRQLMMVRDDGSGMVAEDAKLAFIRHATSKIHSEHDLFRIRSLGFRGEALPSIAAVAKVTLETSTGKTVGTTVVFDNNQLIFEGPAPMRKGTTVKVEQLFYATPARLKHLKSDYTETAVIQDTVSKLALSHPFIRFQLTVDGKVTFQTSGRGQLLEIIGTMWGMDAAKQMLPIEAENADFKISGFISNPTLTKASRYYMMTLLNGRSVRMIPVQNTLIDSYHTYIPDDRYPLAVLHLETDPVLTDINVHPAKHEVRLSKEDSLIALLQDAVKKALTESRYPTMRKTPQLHLKMGMQTSFFNDPLPTPPSEENIIPSGSPQVLQEAPINYEPLLPKEKPVLTPLAQIHGTYIIASVDQGFYLVDQHAAMERVNYEHFMEFFKQNKLQTSTLLVPFVLDLSPQEGPFVMAHLDDLLTWGLKVEPFGKQSIRITEVPTWMAHVDIRIYAEAMIEQLVQGQKLDPLKLRDYAVATLACKASLKANHALSIPEMESILNRLMSCQNPYSCPHGRPTMIFYSTFDLARAFKRA